MLIPKVVTEIGKIAAKIDTRYAISGVRLSRRVAENSWAEVTDGKMGVRVTWSECVPEDFPAGAGDTARRNEFSVLVDAKALVDAGKRINKKQKGQPSGNVLLDETATAGGDSVLFGGFDPSGNWIARSEKVDGTFPNLEEVVPSKSSEGIFVTLDATRLRMLLGVLEGFATRSTVDSAVTFHIKDGSSAVRLVAQAEHGDPVAVGVLMPIRLQD